jgi:hypothetical protein
LPRTADGGHALSSPPPTPSSVPAGHADTAKAPDVNPSVLPKQSQVMAILETYIEEVHPFFSFLHLPTWMDTYEEAVQRQFKGVRRTWLSVLNIVLALRSIALSCEEKRVTAHEKRRNAEIFFERARELSRETLFKVSTTEAGTSSHICSSRIMEMIIISDGVCQSYYGS